MPSSLWTRLVAERRLVDLSVRQVRHQHYHFGHRERDASTYKAVWFTFLTMSMVGLAFTAGSEKWSAKFKGFIEPQVEPPDGGE